MFKLLLKIFLLSVIVFYGCGDDDPVVNPYARINILVKSAADSSVVTGANVILYNAANGNALSRSSSGNDGVAVFENVDPGSFFIKITAQNFNELPPSNISSVPFSASAGQSASVTYFLTPQPGQLGSINGYVNPKIDGVMVKASDGINSYSTYTGPDGYYALFNLTYGTYTLSAFKTGYKSTDGQSVTLSQSQPSAVKDIPVTSVSGSSLKGAVTFLAVENGIVDVSLLDRGTEAAINGLATAIDSNRLYNLSGIPKGEYIAWASFRNDGYVMDPDWIFKNPGGLNISFVSDTGSQSLNFSVTGAVTLIAPTNIPAEILPVEADSSAPLFSWTAYPQAKEYIIEVRNLNGDLLWGGYNSDGTIRHAQIPKSSTSVRFNFDGSASSQLVKGQVYQWKIYADNDDAANIQTLLSRSEDLMGLFYIK
jgi:hypothetical protein